MTRPEPEPDENPSHAPGTHWLVEFVEADREALVRVDQVLDAMREALITAGFTLLGEQSHRFEGGGFTGVFLLSESHASIHTWPERRYAAVDVFTCGDRDASAVFESLRAVLDARAIEITEHPRGPGACKSMSDQADSRT